MCAACSTKQRLLLCTYIVNDHWRDFHTHSMFCLENMTAIIRPIHS